LPPDAVAGLDSRENNRPPANNRAELDAQHRVTAVLLAFVDSLREAVKLTDTREMLESLRRAADRAIRDLGAARPGARAAGASDADGARPTPEAAAACAEPQEAAPACAEPPIPRAPGAQDPAGVHDDDRLATLLSMHPASRAKEDGGGSLAPLPNVLTWRIER
jgi:hypothetical protein